MATVTVTIPDVLIPRLTSAARATFPQYAALTPAQTFQRVTADYWRGVLAIYESNVAQNAGNVTLATAVQAAIDKATADTAGIS